MGRAVQAVDAEAEGFCHSEGEARGIPDAGAGECVSLAWQNQRGDCVVAKSARLRFRLAAKASLAPLFLLFGRDPLRWVRVRGVGSGARE